MQPAAGRKAQAFAVVNAYSVHSAAKHKHLLPHRDVLRLHTKVKLSKV